MDEEEEKEKIPHMCENIGHRPFRGRCPAPSLNHGLLEQGTDTADHLLRLLLFRSITLLLLRLLLFFFHLRYRQLLVV